MALDSGQREKERLAGMYGVMGDGELLDLHSSMGDLTDAGQAALREEMSRRRLEPPALEAEDEETAGSAKGLIEADSGSPWKVLHVFNQTFEAQHAFRLLERAEIPFTVEDRTVDEKGDLRPGPAVQLALAVEEGEWAAAVKLLRRDAGLFPEDVGDTRVSQHVDDEEGVQESVTVGDFEDGAELAEAAQMLTEAGIPFEVLQHQEEGWMGSSIQVHGENVEQAIAVLERLAGGDASRL